jgi:hypothetical protein
MKAKIKNKLLAVIISFQFMTCINAQVKYEYAIVTSENFKVVVTKHTKDKFSFDKETNDMNSAIIIKVEEMEKEGWEVFNVSPTGGFQGGFVHFFYLRRKI